MSAPSNTKAFLLSENQKRKTESLGKIFDLSAEIFKIVDQLDDEYQILADLRYGIKEIRESWTDLEEKDGSIFDKVLLDSVCPTIRRSFADLISVSVFIISLLL